MSLISKISKAALTAGIVAGVSMSTAMAKDLTLASFVSARHHLQTNIWEPLAEDIKKATNGELTITIYPGGKLGAGPTEQFNRAVNGVTDIAHGLPGYTSVLFPKTLLMEFPGVPRSAEAGTAAFWDSMDLIKDEYRRVKLLGLFTSASASILTRDKPVRKPEDLRGMKIRVPSANVGKAVSAWGGTAVSMPISEVYNALQTGVIDGVLVDTSVLNSFKLKEVVNYVTDGVPSTTSVLFLVMNRNSWKNLSESEQAALDKLTGRVLSEKSNQSYAESAKKGLADFRAMDGKTVIDLTAAETASFDKLSRSLIDEAVADLSKKGVDAEALVTAFGK